VKKRAKRGESRALAQFPTPLEMAFVQTLFRQRDRSVAAASAALGLTEAEGRRISVKSRVKQYMCIYSEHYARFLVEHMVDETFREADGMFEKTPEQNAKLRDVRNI
jgi:hypothetical protein